MEQIIKPVVHLTLAYSYEGGQLMDRFITGDSAVLPLKRREILEHLDHISSRFLSSFQSSLRTVDKLSPCLQPEEIQTKTKRFLKLANLMLKYLAIAQKTNNSRKDLSCQFSLSRK